MMIHVPLHNNLWSRKGSKRCSAILAIFIVHMNVGITVAFLNNAPLIIPRSSSSGNINIRNPMSMSMHQIRHEAYGFIPKSQSSLASSTSSTTRSSTDMKNMLSKECSKSHKSKEKKRTSPLMASLIDDSDETEIKDPIPLKDDKEFIAAVKEVKEAALNVTASSVQLTSAIVTKGPGILRRLFAMVVSKELRNDFGRRRKHYISDWTDAFSHLNQCIPAILFLYFSCLAPVVSFGTIASQITEGTIGVVEFLVASATAGMSYSVLSGQPMTFIAPTGLSLAFMSGLYRFCSMNGFDFLPIYTWVGLWTALFMISMGFRGGGKLIRLVTRFTDEVFNGLLSLNFIYEGAVSLRRNFLLADPLNLSMPFVSLSIALGTYFSTAQVIALEKSIYFSKKVRKAIKDFGPVAVLFAFSAFNQLGSIKKFKVPTLVVPQHFQLAGGRKFLVDFLKVPIRQRWLCVFPAVLLTSLFFMDQNISARVVNKEENKLQKGEAYNIDMVALGIITGVLSIFGLPWMCGATVQSMNHVRAMTTLKFNNETQEMEIDHVTETRTTGFVTHALLGGTLFLLPLLTYLPIPVVSGVFLFLGRKLMSGNTFLQRILDAFSEKSRLPANHPIQVLGRKRMNIFTGIQIACLAGLWAFKQNSKISIFFPSVIGMLMVIRSFILPKIFTKEELVAIGDPDPLL
mmetsp:Transcript_6246/g.6992  ORF Transcript_6246/g.6992 Transcript_6246/m.6992 type:complete len:685 (+) Transcript_6246:312-2366(+)